MTTRDEPDRRLSAILGVTVRAAVELSTTLGTVVRAVEAGDTDRRRRALADVARLRAEAPGMPD